MKVQIIYSSLSGCTRKVAEGIYHSLTGVDKSIHDLKDGEPVLDGDILLLGYWVDKGGPNEQMHAFLEKTEGERPVGYFSVHWPLCRFRAWLSIAEKRC